MKAEVYNKENKKVDTIELSDRVFGAKWNPALVHQVLVSESANRRKPYASTKDRSEVRGGGRKPWAQKGLGRARHGSIRSPIWVGGGVTHGPRPEKDYGKKINKKMKRTAIYSVLSKK
ncbi:MAG: 50S ribosomal protein L4, partial [Candidatus Jorgensenbacteria bacterium]